MRQWLTYDHIGIGDHGDIAVWRDCSQYIAFKLPVISLTPQHNLHRPTQAS